MRAALALAPVLALLPALHPGIIIPPPEDEVEHPTDRPPQFDGGVRGDSCNAPRHVEPPWWRNGVPPWGDDQVVAMQNGLMARSTRFATSAVGRTSRF